LSYIGAKPLIAEYYYDSFSGNGVLDSFVTTIEPGSPVSAIVVIDGAVISPEDYYFDGTYIKFATPPAAGTSNIQIRYLAIPASGIAAPKTFRQVAEYYATSGQTLFPVQRYDLGYVDVYVNGVQLGNLDGDVLPTTANTYDLGSANSPFHSVYVGPGSVYIGNAAIKLVDGSIKIDNAALQIGDLNVTGNLIVEGTTTEILTSSITANDTLMYLGANNYYSDTHDIGFVSNYNDGATNRHAGFFRKSGTTDFYAFYNYEPEVDSNNNIDINHASFRSANINAGNIYASGNLFSNGVNITNVTSQLITGNTPPTTVVTYVNSAIITALSNIPEPLGANSAVRLSDLVSLPSDLFINVLGSLDIQLTATKEL